MAFSPAIDKITEPDEITPLLLRIVLLIKHQFYAVFSLPNNTCRMLQPSRRSSRQLDGLPKEPYRQPTATTSNHLTNQANTGNSQEQHRNIRPKISPSSYTSTQINCQPRQSPTSYPTNPASNNRSPLHPHRRQPKQYLTQNVYLRK